MSSSTNHSRTTVVQAVTDVALSSIPEAQRKRIYNGRRHRFVYPPFHLATVNQVNEVLGCVGCRVRDTRGVRVIDVLKGCPVHGQRGPDTLGEFRDAVKREESTDA
jgi:hypothetical protein